MSRPRTQAETASMCWFLCAAIAAALLVVSVAYAVAGGGFLPPLIWGLLAVFFASGGLIFRRLS